MLSRLLVQEYLLLTFSRIASALNSFFLPNYHPSPFFVNADDVAASSCKQASPSK
jgi:hypothetical protein